MAKKYVFSIGENGKVLTGTILDYPDEYTVEGTKQVWENQERAFYDAQSGNWTVYDRLSAAGPASATVGETITVTATLPAGSPDTEVSFQVRFGSETSDPVSVPVTSGAAEQELTFDVEGAYQIIASSVHHGSAFLGVNVVEQTGNPE